jgi:multidrug resistance protein
MNTTAPALDADRRAANAVSRRNVLLLSFVLLVVMIGYSVAMPLLPFYIEAFGVGGTQLGWLMSTYSLMQLICAPLWGILSDRYGRKPVLCVGVLGYALALFLIGLANSFTMLFLARSLSGLLSSAVMPSSMAYIGENSPEGERSKGMGQLGAATGIGVIIGPLVGGLLSTRSLALPFFVGSGLALLSLLLIIFLLPESRHVHPSAQVFGRASLKRASSTPAARAGEPDRADRPTAGLRWWQRGNQSSEGATAHSHPSPSDPPVIASPVFSRAKQSRSSPSVHPTIRLYTQLLLGPAGVLLLLLFIMSFGMTNFQGMLGLYFVDKFGSGTQQVSYIWMLMGLILIVAQGVLVGPLTKVLGELRLIKLGLLGGALGFALMALAMNYAVAMLALGFFILAVALIGPALNSHISGFAGQQQGAVMGLNSAFSSLGRIAGPLWGGYIYDVNITYPFFSGAATLLLGLVFSLFTLRGTQAPPAAAA